MERSGAETRGSQVQSLLFVGIPVVLGPYAVLEEGCKDLGTEVVAAEEVLACAHKALQHLKVKKQLVLFSSTVTTIPL